MLLPLSALAFRIAAIKGRLLKKVGSHCQCFQPGQNQPGRKRLEWAGRQGP